MITRRRSGFSLTELLVLIALLALLIGFFLPAIAKTRASAERIKCSNNIRQCVIAAHNSHDSFGYIPSNTDMIGNVNGTLHLFLLNFMEQKAVYDAVVNKTEGATGVIIKSMVCPADPTTTGNDKYGPAAYATNNLLFAQRVKLPGSLPDGTSNTIMFAEKYAQCSYWALTKSDGKSVIQVPWYVATQKSGFQVLPEKPDCKLPQTAHPEGINVGMGDGRVITVKKSLTLKTWYAANTPNGGEILGGKDYEDWTGK